MCILQKMFCFDKEESNERLLDVVNEMCKEVEEKGEDGEKITKKFKKVKVVSGLSGGNILVMMSFTGISISTGWSKDATFEKIVNVCELLASDETDSESKINELLGVQTPSTSSAMYNKVVLNCARISNSGSGSGEHCIKEGDLDIDFKGISRTVIVTMVSHIIMTQFVFKSTEKIRLLVRLVNESVNA